MGQPGTTVGDEGTRLGQVLTCKCWDCAAYRGHLLRRRAARAPRQERVPAEGDDGDLTPAQRPSRARNARTASARVGAPPSASS